MWSVFFNSIHKIASTISVCTHTSSAIQRQYYNFYFIGISNCRKDLTYSSRSHAFRARQIHIVLWASGIHLNSSRRSIVLEIVAIYRRQMHCFGPRRAGNFHLNRSLVIYWQSRLHSFWIALYKLRIWRLFFFSKQGKQLLFTQF